MKRALPDPTFKARMAYARSIRRGSRKHVSADVFKATVAEAIKVVKPATKVDPALAAVTKGVRAVVKDWTKALDEGAELVTK